MSRCVTALFVALIASCWLGIGCAAKPAQINDAKDKQLLAAFLKQVADVPNRITAEYCKKAADTDADESETYTWLVTPYVHTTLAAYELTGDPTYLDEFVGLFENERSALTTGPDGFLGWYGIPDPNDGDPNDPTHRTDAVISSFRTVEMICDFVTLIDRDPALRKKYAAQRKAYLDLAENHLVKKHTVRGDYVDLGRGGAVYRSVAHGMNARQTRLTMPHNKNSIIMHGLLALYRVTGNDEYMRKAIELGVRYKHSLTLKNGHYEWNYWDPAGAWDVRKQAPTEGRHGAQHETTVLREWKHWIGPEHRGGYYSSTLSQAIALYDYGLVFDKTDVDRFLRTQLEMCWNGSMTDPKWARVDGTTPAQYTQGEYICDALAPFSDKVAEFLYTGARQDQLLRESGDDWSGGPIASGWLEGKLIELPAAKGGKQVYLDYGKRFLAKKANRDFLKALAFQVTPPGYTAPEVPSQMKDMPQEPGAE